MANDPSHPSPKKPTPDSAIDRTELFDGLRPRGRRNSSALTPVPPSPPDPNFFDIFGWNGGDRLL